MRYGPDEHPTLVITLAVAVTLVVSIGFIAAGEWLHGSHDHSHEGHASMASHEDSSHAKHAAMAANLDRTAIVSPGTEPLDPPALESTNSVSMASQLDGKWSLLFFGFTSCPHVCPTTLNTLARVAAVPGGDLADGSAQVLFVSVDPETDTRDRIATYLGKFDPDFIGYTGSMEDIQAFSDQVGAAFSVTEEGIDHSTSVFVIDPTGRPAGVLLRPSDDQRLLQDFEIVQHAAQEQHGQPAIAAHHAGSHH